MFDMTGMLHLNALQLLSYKPHVAVQQFTACIAVMPFHVSSVEVSGLCAAPYHEYHNLYSRQAEVIVARDQENGGGISQDTLGFW